MDSHACKAGAGWGSTEIFGKGAPKRCPLPLGMAGAGPCSWPVKVAWGEESNVRTRYLWVWVTGTTPGVRTRAGSLDGAGPGALEKSVSKKKHTLTRGGRRGRISFPDKSLASPRCSFRPIHPEPGNAENILPRQDRGWTKHGTGGFPQPRNLGAAYNRPPGRRGLFWAGQGRVGRFFLGSRFRSQWTRPTAVEWDHIQSPTLTWVRRIIVEILPSRRAPGWLDGGPPKGRP